MYRAASLSPFVLLTTLLAAPLAEAQFYNPSAGDNVITEMVPMPVVAPDGTTSYEEVEQRVQADGYGNALGSQYDLAVDGAFEGQTIVVLHFYTAEGFDFSLPEQALRSKGFSVYRWSNGAPSVEELHEALDQACQLWLISGSQRLLSDAHVDVIRNFWNEGHGVYIWGDNEPYYADANVVAQALFGGEMLGNLTGNQVVSLQQAAGGPGLVEGHLVTTGLEYLYEGITIATIQPNETLSPLLWGSAGNLVVGYYDQDGRRAILDGGFTRLYCNWDTAGTARYVTNAASWLVNVERFGEALAATLPVEGASVRP